MKKCLKCLVEKEFCKFSPKRKGYASQCKECIAQTKRSRYFKKKKLQTNITEKECNICLKTKNVEQFSKNSKCSTYRNDCISCCSSRNKKRVEYLQSIIRKAKDVPCKDCNIRYQFYIMDFDHIDSKEKLFTIGQTGRYASEENLLKEIAKCDVVCANCHRARTFSRMKEKISNAII